MARMNAPLVALRNLSFSYPGALAPVFSGAGATFPTGFTAVIGANGSGKSTLLKLMAGQLKPDEGSLEGFADVVYCEQRTDHPPALLAEMLSDWDAAAFELRGRLGVPEDALERWDELSHGERKRVQIAAALWQQPTILLIDEPTNHIDSAGRALLESALQQFSGVGVIVSHDRDLLDALCLQSLWLRPPTIETIAGGYSESLEQRNRSRVSDQRTRDRLRSEQKKLDAEVSRRRERANRANADRSKRGVNSKDSDAREKINRARLTGKDGTAGKLLRQLDGRAAQHREALEAAKFEKEYASDIWVTGEASKAKVLFTRPAGSLALGPGRTLTYPDLLMRPTDRIAVTGLNGTGKSTLLAALLDDLALAEDRLLLMPQEVSAQRSTELLNDLKSLARSEQGKADLGLVMSIVSRLGSRPAQLLESEEPSPGELRKLLLALGIVKKPYLLVLDEPTNHLDLLSIESLEQALAGCPCGLLIVSHDQRLVSALTDIEWSITSEGDAQSGGDSYLEVKR